MTARFIFSLDCEGKWGGADKRSESLAFITREMLRDAYTRILDIMDRHDFRASFGFVAALCLEPDELQHQLVDLGDVMRYRGRDWLTTVKQEVSGAVFNGWSAPELIRLVAGSGHHHITSHGGIHIPYSEAETSSEAIACDIALIRHFYERIGKKPDVLIFPRNIVGFREQLAGFGFRGYRDVDFGERTGGYRGKLVRFANEVVSLDIGDTARHEYCASEGMLALTPAKFFNARIGVRRFISSELTNKRMLALIEYAIQNSGTVHLYTHPHNFISDPSMLAKLDWLLTMVGQYVEEGKMNVITMEDELNEYFR